MKKLDIQLTFCSYFCSVALMLLGGVSLFGWLLKVPPFFQFTSLAFIPANAALCLMLSGMALFLTIRSQFRIVQILSIIIIVFSGLTLCQYLFSLNFGIDELLFKDIIYSGASQPNRMAPNTALCFFLFATALFVSTYSLNSNVGNLIVAILGALVFVLAFVALAGFLFGFEEAFGWGVATRMPPQLAIIFIFASLCISCLVWQNISKLDQGFPGWSASLAILAVVTVFTGIWQTLIIKERHFIKSDAELKHHAAASQILFHLKERTLALERMAQRFQSHQGQAIAEEQWRMEWRQDAINYINHFGDFKSIGRVDSAYSVKWSVATDDDERVESNLMGNPNLAQAMSYARESGDSWVSPISPQGVGFFPFLCP